MKTLLAMKHRVLPPTANFESPTNKIDLSNSPFQGISTTGALGKSIAMLHVVQAISGFGFGGINAHVFIGRIHKTKQLKRLR